jgi:hypothetical protein
MYANQNAASPPTSKTVQAKSKFLLLWYYILLLPTIDDITTLGLVTSVVKGATD